LKGEGVVLSLRFLRSLRYGVFEGSLPVAFLGFGLLAFSGCQDQGPAAPPDSALSEDPFNGTIILGRVTDQAITANLLWDRDAEVYLEYGTESGTYPHLSPSEQLEAGTPVNLVLGQLQPDTRYVYRVRTGPVGQSPEEEPEEHTFHTQRARGSEFLFTVDADPHWGDVNFDAEVYSTTMETILGDAPDFHIDLGDSFMTEKRDPANFEDVVGIVSGLRPFWATIGSSVPLYLVMGNHEGEQGWDLDGTGENLPIWAIRARQLYYPSPTPNDFYSGSRTPEPWIGTRDGFYAWEWGDALFVVLDPYWYTSTNPHKDFWSWTLGNEQHEWLMRTLRESTASFKFVFAHQLIGGLGDTPRGGVEAAPYYEWGGQNPDRSWGFDQHRAGWQAPIHQLFIETGVTAFFHGHDHFFAKQELDGVVYQLVPQPSYARATDNYSAAEYGYLSGDMLGSSGYLRIGVSPSLAMVEYVKVYPPGVGNGKQTGDVVYSYALSPRN
jgi:hypothetical protein